MADFLDGASPETREHLENLVSRTTAEEIIKYRGRSEPEQLTVQIEFENRDELVAAMEFVCDSLVEQKRLFVWSALWRAASSEGMYHANLYRILLKLQANLQAARDALPKA